MKSNNTFIALLVFVGVVLPALFSFITLNPDFFYTEDAAKYILLGQSLATGRGYTSIWEITPSPHGKYAPLLPLLIAPFSILTPDNILIIKIIMKILGLFAAIAIFAYFYKKKAGVLESLLVTATYIIPTTFFYYSEGPNPLHLYTLLSFLGLSYLETFNENGPNAVRQGYIAAVLCTLCFFSKGNGIALIAAGYAILLLSRFAPEKENQKRALIFITVTSIAVLCWFGRAALISGPSHSGYGYSYTSELFIKDMRLPIEEQRAAIMDFAVRILNNAVYYAKDLVVTSDNVYIILLQSYLFLFGLFRAIKTENKLAALYCIFYMAVILVWPFNGTRMYLPIRPLVAYFTIAGLSAYLKIGKIKKITRSAAAIATALAICFLSFTNISKIEYAYNHRPQEFLDFIKACDAVKRRMSYDDTFYSSIAPAFYLYTNRHASYPPLTRDNAKMLERFKRDGVDYVMLQKWGNAFSYELLLPFIEANPAHFNKIYQNETCQIYKVIGI